MIDQSESRLNAFLPDQHHIGQLREPPRQVECRRMAYKRSRTTFEADLPTQQSPYVVYGTPLPPLDRDARDDGTYVPVWKQEVTDEKGRKRLHGAFTGGFSAG